MIREKLGGICCTTAIGGSPSGNRGRRKRSASTPPVEAPIRMTRRAENSPGGMDSETGGAVTLGFRATDAGVATSAGGRLDVIGELMGHFPQGLLPFGLASTSSAPAASASRALADPCGVRAN